MITIVSISLALLVIVAGMLLLAKTKKEELSGLFTFTSYAVITCGILLAAHAFVGGIMNCHSKCGGQGDSAYAECHRGGQGGNYHSSYGKNPHQSKCEYKGYSHGSKKNCSKSGCTKSKCSKGTCSKTSCAKGAKSCKKGVGCCKSLGKKKEIRKIIKTGEDGEEEIDVTVEIIE